MKTILMKKFQMAILLTIIVIGFMGNTHLAFAKDTNKKAHKAYAETINQLDNVICEGYYFKYFTLFDLNNDGIDECIVNYICGRGEENTFSKMKNSYKNPASNTILFYTYYNGKVKKLYELFYYDGNGGALFINKKKGTVTDYWHASAFEEGGTTYSVKNGKFKQIHSYQYNENIDEYKSDGKNVSKDTLHKKMKKLGVYESTTFQFYKGTKKNVSKYCFLD